MTRRVLEPFRLGPLSLKNRLVFAPITTGYAGERGDVTTQLLAHYEARARGGAGLIIVEATYVDPVGQVFNHQLGIYDDSLVPGLRELAGVIKKHGCAVAIQIHHGGRMARSQFTGMQPVAPSAIADPKGEIPRELSEADVRDTVQSFVRAAVRAREAGFSAVEIHGAHSYLVDQFISPAANLRTDCYGGNVANRARFMVEIFEGVRAATGPGFPVWVRINGREYGVDGGTTLEDALQVAKLAERAGSVAVHVSAYGPATPTNRTTAVFKPAVLADLAAAMKQVLSVPVIAVGRITPDAAEDLIETNRADLIAVGKGLLADPDIPRKLAAGREDRIVPCIVCMSCRDVLQTPSLVGITCQVNPRLGRDFEPDAAETTNPRRVLVVGGGPAGMVAAAIAAERGHSVTLWERTGALGGQLLQAAVPPHKDRIRAYTEYLKRELARTRVKVELEREANEEAILKAQADVVVLATGPRQGIPDVPGIESAGAVDATAVLDGAAEVGRRVVIIGGELVGCETAEFLAERGRTVTVTRRGPEMATGVGPSLRPFLLDRLRQKGVVLLPGVKYLSARPGCLTVQTADGATLALEADTIVRATGSLADARLHDALEGKVAEVCMVGDCAEPRKIGDAVREAYEVGRRL
ncbi:MAG: FAD-dependent oxidoreductase [Dehalococcoidia bacterium]|nr:MAG: FAD-dependent oxidoreductase [Dehalococcoidia bacterium]